MLKLTPESFVEVIVLCLFWEFWPPKIIKTEKGRGNHTGTTVGHVLEILRKIGAITDVQIRLIRHKYDGQPYQRKLYRHCAVFLNGSCVMKPDSWILCRQYLSAGRNVWLKDLVRDQKIDLLDEGARIAESQLVERYKGMLSKDAYMNEGENHGRIGSVVSRSHVSGVQKILET